MLINVELSSNVPIYRQLEKQIVEMILSGTLKPGDKLPPVRELAAEVQVNPNTIAKVYLLLEQSNYIYTRRGSGTFVAEIDHVESRKETRRKIQADFKAVLDKARRLGLSEAEISSIMDSLQKNEMILE